MRLEKAIKEYLIFLKHPTIDYKREAPLGPLVVIKLFFIVFALEMLLFLPISSALGLEDIPHAMESIMENMSTWQVIGLAVILAPLLEELIFRFHLRYSVLCLVFLTFVGLGYLGIIFSSIYPELLTDIPTSTAALIENPLVIAIGFISVFLLSGIIYLISRRLNRKSLSAFYPFVFYLTASVFALVHISNFQLPPERWFIAPLLVIPQFILACYLGYVRVRNHIGYSIFIHAFNNAIPVLLFSLATKSGAF